MRSGRRGRRNGHSRGQRRLRSGASGVLPRDPKTFPVPLKALRPRPERPVRTVEVSSAYL